tara:strand:+ start:1387 stop:2487 length:1101 start_codon:yes stop_codon:yes gene_type:complete
MLRKKNNKIFFFLPSFADGGAEENIISLAKKYKQQNEKVTFIVGNQTGINKLKMDKKIKVIDLKKNKLYKCLFQILRIFKKRSPDTVITTLVHSNLFLCFIKFFYKHQFKLIIRETNITPFINLSLKKIIKFKVLNFLKKILYNCADYILAINSQSKKELIKLGIQRRKIKILNNPSIKNDFHKKIREKIVNKNIIKNRYALYVGRLIAHKNVNFLIKVFYEVQKKIDLNLILIGQGNEIYTLKTLVKKLGIKKKVFFLGYKQNPLPYMRKADIHLSFSEYEGQPNSVIQSLGCGTKTFIKSYPGLNKNIKNSKNIKIFDKLDKSLISNFVIKNLKLRGVKKSDNKIIKTFDESYYADQVKKMIYA